MLINVNEYSSFRSVCGMAFGCASVAKRPSETFQTALLIACCLFFRCITIGIVNLAFGNIHADADGGTDFGIDFVGNLGVFF